MNRNDDKQRMARVFEAMCQSGEVLNDMTPTQMALLSDLGVAPVELWLALVALTLQGPVDSADRDDHISSSLRPACGDDQ